VCLSHQNKAILEGRISMTKFRLGTNAIKLPEKKKEGTFIL
jgi:hypothetical protein